MYGVEHFNMELKPGIGSNFDIAHVSDEDKRMNQLFLKMMKAKDKSKVYHAICVLLNQKDPD